MFKIKIKVLEKVFDEYGVTIVMRRQKIQKTEWWKPGKVLSEKNITIWTTNESDLIKRIDFNPPHDWLVVNPSFRHYERDCREIGIKCVLKDKDMLKIANRILTF